jgi:hypothetical protein
MATQSEHAHIFGFDEDGTTITIHQPDKIGDVLAKYFRHRHMTSFVRQLNNYGFRTALNTHCFYHPYFRRDAAYCLSKVVRGDDTRKRKKPVRLTQAQRIKELTKQVQLLEERNTELSIEIDRLRIVPELFDGWKFQGFI